MANQELHYQPSSLSGLVQRTTNFVQLWLSEQHRTTRQVAVGAILTLALVAFELFNFDTTEFALENLLGTVSFASVRWATILAIAFCSIDFAGLARLIAPDPVQIKRDEGGVLKPTYLLLGAWLLGGGMNAIMTWWAVSLALMGHNLGNEVLSREQLLRVVPIFVALLVWLTRLLIISSFVMTSDQALARVGRRSRRSQTQSRPAAVAVTQPQPVVAAAQSGAARAAARAATRSSQPTPQPDAVVPTPPVFVGDEEEQTPIRPAPVRPNGQSPQRPAMPRPPRGVRPSAVPMRAGSARNSKQLL